MTEDKFSELLALGHETTGVEFKSPGSRGDKNLFAKVARAVLGMANRRDGGLVVVGVGDDGTPVGLSSSECRTWTHDAVAGALAKYADPYVEVHTKIFEYEGRKFALIEVEEFREVPVLCKKNFEPPKLRDGACYVRRRGRIETSEIPTQAEMRSLLELATEKRLRSFVRQLQVTGLGAQAEGSDADLFDQELGEF